jgi:alanyl aminopeptidase
MAFVLLGTRRCAHAETAPIAGLRLGDEAEPSKQALTLDLDPAKETFIGSTSIEVRLKRAVRAIRLNAFELEVTRARARGASGALEATVVRESPDVVAIRLGAPAGPGIVTLDLDFTGAVSRRDMRGLFAQKAGDRWYLLSQLEAIEARRAFPCFDEPTYKVPWTVTLRVPSSLVAVSNAPVASETPGEGGAKTVRFEETAPLPSYLVAVAVGPFDVVDLGAVGRGKTPVRLLVEKGRAKETAFAAEATRRSLSLLEEYFDARYPFPKLDQVEVPNAANHLAMENAGLVTYGDAFLLAPPGGESATFKRESTNVIAHELAHQWFGDLVTMSWWDDIWLNESFASWMADKVQARIDPRSPGASIARGRALDFDGTASSRAVREKVTKRDDIDSFLSPIVYDKGETLLFMLETWLGEDAVQRGIRRYLAGRPYQNVSSADFLHDVGESAGADVAGTLGGFLDRPGAPVLGVELRCDGAPRAVLTQKPYAALGATAGAGAWKVPVAIRFPAEGGERHVSAVVAGTRAEVPLGVATCPAWIWANDGGHGYFRQSLGPPLLAALLAKGSLAPEEKIALLSDGAALAESGDLDATQLFAMIEAFAKDADPRVVLATVYVTRRFGTWAEDGRAFSTVVRRLYGPGARAAGLAARTGEDDDARLLRAELLGMVTRRGDDAELGAQCARLAARWLEDGKSLSPELREPVLRGAARFGDDALYARLVAAAFAAREDRETREALFIAAASVKSPARVKTALSLVLDERVSANDAAHVLATLSYQRDTLPAVTAFLKESWDALAKRLPDGIFYPSIIYAPTLYEDACDAASRDFVTAFVGPRTKRFGGA